MSAEASEREYQVVLIHSPGSIRGWLAYSARYASEQGWCDPQIYQEVTVRARSMAQAKNNAITLANRGELGVVRNGPHKETDIDTARYLAEQLLGWKRRPFAAAGKEAWSAPDGRIHSEFQPLTSSADMGLVVNAMREAGFTVRLSLTQALVGSPSDGKWECQFENLHCGVVSRYGESAPQAVAFAAEAALEAAVFASAAQLALGLE